MLICTTLMILLAYLRSLARCLLAPVNRFDILIYLDREKLPTLCCPLCNVIYGIPLQPLPALIARSGNTLQDALKKMQLNVMVSDCLEKIIII
jgi:hypothetical protein